MIENFDEIKKQLKELSEVINGFKSEAVQLRLIDLVFGEIASSSEDVDQAVPKKRSRKTTRKKQVKGTTGVQSGSANQTEKKTRKKTSGRGAIATLGKVYEDGFFATSRTINDILTHCETNLARKIKSNEISGKLARMVRNGELSRNKNADGQYEYNNP